MGWKVGGSDGNEGMKEYELKEAAVTEGDVKLKISWQGRFWR